MSDRWRSLFCRYGAAFVAIVLATLLRIWLDPFLENHAPFSTYFVAIMFAAWYGGIGPSADGHGCRRFGGGLLFHRTSRFRLSLPLGCL